MTRFECLTGSRLSTYSASLKAQELKKIFLKILHHKPKNSWEFPNFGKETKKFFRQTSTNAPGSAYPLSLLITVIINISLMCMILLNVSAFFRRGIFLFNKKNSEWKWMLMFSLRIFYYYVGICEKNKLFTGWLHVTFNYFRTIFFWGDEFWFFSYENL